MKFINLLFLINIVFSLACTTYSDCKFCGAFKFRTCDVTCTCQCFGQDIRDACDSSRVEQKEIQFEVSQSKPLTEEEKKLVANFPLPDPSTVRDSGPRMQLPDGRFIDE